MSRFEAWLKAAKPGETYPYHTGRFLFETPQVYAVRKAFDDGLVELVQRRIEQPKNPRSLGEDGLGRFEYLAVKRRNIVQRDPCDWATQAF